MQYFVDVHRPLTKLLILLFAFVFGNDDHCSITTVGSRHVTRYVLDSLALGFTVRCYVLRSKIDSFAIHIHGTMIGHSEDRCSVNN